MLKLEENLKKFSEKRKKEMDKIEEREKAKLAKGVLIRFETDLGNLFHQPYIHLIQSSSGLYFKRVQTVLVASTAVLCVVTQRSSALSCVTTQRKAA